MRYETRWTVGEWTFYEVADHKFSDFEGQPLYGFELVSGERRPGTDELYATLEWAMAAAIAEKHTGGRGAGGTGVGTAADWFIKMIGADGTALTPAGDAGPTALLNAIETADGFPGVGAQEYAERIVDRLATRGYVLARRP